MGGSGKSTGLTLKQLEELRKQRRLRKGEPSGSAGRRNVYISFASEDLDEVNLLRGQAKNENSNVEFNDFSLKQPFDSRDSEYIKRGIRERIRQASVTIVYVSSDAASSRWVDWEVRESLRMGKGVVGMYKGDSPPLFLPDAVRSNRIRVVPWNQKELSRAVEEAARG